MITSAYLINLPEHKERYDRAQKELERVGISALPIHASRPNRLFIEDYDEGKYSKYSRGGLGCALSHLQALIAALNSPSRNAAIFEDDVVFKDGIKEKWHLPHNWNILYLGGIPLSPTKAENGHIVRVGQMSCAHAYVINLETEEHRGKIRGLIYYTIDHLTKYAFDQILSQYAQTCNAFCVYPPVAYQLPGDSTIEGEYRDYTEMTKQAWEKFKP